MRAAAQSDSAELPGPDTLNVPLAFSVLFHLLLFSSLVISTFFSHSGENWGGAGGGAITVGLVGSVPGVTLPRPDVVTENRVVDQTKGLYQSELDKPVPPPPDATELPEFSKEKPPKYVTKKSRLLENKTPPPPNAVPYGQGGAPAVPYSSFTMGAGTQAGMGVSGAGGGNFGSRFPWYVEAVQRKVSSNWLQSAVDPSIQWAPRVVASFQVLRDGTVTDIQILRSSGNSSVDTSAVRAISNSSPMSPLPPEYSGSNVNVEFWFDFRR